MAKINEQFAINNGDGEGYTVYYKRGNACFYYGVTYNENGVRIYSATRRIKAAEYEAIKRNNKAIHARVNQ